MGKLDARNIEKTLSILQRGKHKKRIKMKLINKLIFGGYKSLSRTQRLAMSDSDLVKQANNTEREKILRDFGLKK